jgi:hypothetical protein
MATGSAVDRAARAIKRANTTSPAWVQRRQQVSMHQGTLTRVDVFNGVADFQFPDPGGLIVPSVNYVRPYSDSNPPSVGDVVWGMHNGTDFMIWGQHVSLNGFVSM